MVMNISCKFEKSTYNTLASGGVTKKSLHTVAAAYSCVIHSIHRMLSGGYNYILLMISTIDWIQEFLKDFLSLHSKAILKVLGLGGDMHSPSAFV